MSELLTPDLHPIQIDTNDIIELVKSLETHKDVGPDKIPAYLLNETCEIIAPSLTFIFQASLHQCSLQYDWKDAYIVPLFKKGDHSTSSNYRPVLLTCI